MHLYESIIEALKATDKYNSRYWTDGSEIFCETEEQADAIANLLEDCGYDVVITTEYEEENFWAIYPD